MEKIEIFIIMMIDFKTLQDKWREKGGEEEVTKIELIDHLLLILNQRNDFGVSYSILQELFDGLVFFLSYIINLFPIKAFGINQTEHRRVVVILASKLK